MSLRHVHYEAAFEDFIRANGWPYVPVDESRRPIFAGKRIKSFDFLVYRPGATAWLVDVKGRQFPYQLSGSVRYWENWVTRGDLDSLAEWERVFGADFEGVFVFAYLLTPACKRPPSDNVHSFRGNSYAFLWTTAREYAALARTRSPQWDTVSLATSKLRSILRPVA